MDRSTDTLEPVTGTAGTSPAARPAAPPYGPGDQARAFRRLRGRLARNGLRVLLESGRVKLFTMIATSVAVALFVFGFSLYGFHSLFRFNIPFKGLIVGGLFDLMFFTLGVMLLFSTGVILYASLFTAPEARFLLTTPARADRVFAAKFEAAVAFSSWGFVVLGLPILVAYGLVAGVPWYFYPLLPAYLLGFVLLPGAVSALACLLLVRYLPRNRRQALVAIGAVAVAVAGVWLYRVSVAARSTLVTNQKDALEGFVGQFALAQHPLTPSHWMTNGVLAAARGEFAGALVPLALLWSNGLMAYLLAAWTAGRVYRTGYDRITGAGRGKKVYRGSVLDRVMGWLVFYLDRPTRILVVKDFRTFRRDPTQWVLLAIVGGLMVLGASNFRRYYTADLETVDKYIVGLMNLGGVAMLLCAGLSRFIFPLVSLEGRKFWILGLMPIERRQILLGKFAFAGTVSVLTAVGLILTGETILGIPAEGVLIHLLAGVTIAVGLSGLNVGLGAYMPNFRETDPSKIVVGFSGTVNMVVGLLFLVVELAVMAGPLHAAAVVKHFRGEPIGAFPWWVYAGLPVGVLAGAAATWLPLRAGAKALRETEF
jgi:ABC-2 type transport system permease protein